MQGESFAYSRSSWRSYVLAMGCVLGAAAVCGVTKKLIDTQIPFMVFVLAALVAAWRGGVGPGIAALIAGAILGDYVFLSPYGSAEHHGQVEVMLLLSYGLTTLASVLLIGALRGAHRRAEATKWEAISHVKRLEEEAAERKRAEAALRDNEAELKAIFENTPLPMLLLDGRRVVRKANKAAGRLSGDRPERLLGKAGGEAIRCVGHLNSFGGCGHGESCRACRVLLTVEDTLATGRPHADVEASVAVADATGMQEIHLLVSTTPLRVGGERMVLACLDNVTERKRAEEAMAEARKAAEEANRAKDDFLAVLSHELRTPLTPVLLTASVLERRADLPEDMRVDIETIRRNVQLEARIIDDLLDLTRIVKGKLTFDFQTADIHLLIRSAADICGCGEGARIHLDLRAGRRFVRGDAARLQQVFWNLLSNARKFTPADGTITVRSSNTEDGKVQVEIVDTGVGIERECLLRIFSAFEQGEAGRVRKFGGLGLGLAISRAIMDAHGGTVTAHSEGKGTGATLTVEMTVAAESAARTAEQPRQETEARQRSLRILLVEDHVSTLEVLMRLLTAMGHEVCTAASRQLAMAAAEGAEFDLVISDLGLPDGTGHELMRWLRERCPLKGIALSGYGMEEDMRRSREAGFEAHLTKPVNIADLEATIWRVVGEGRAAGV